GRVGGPDVAEGRVEPGVAGLRAVGDRCEVELRRVVTILVTVAVAGQARVALGGLVVAVGADVRARYTCVGGRGALAVVAASEGEQTEQRQHWRTEASSHGDILIPARPAM